MTDFDKIEREIADSLGYVNKPKNYADMRMDVLKLTKSMRLLLDVARTGADISVVPLEGTPWLEFDKALTALGEHCDD